MHRVIEDNLDALRELCIRYRVTRLEVFGSAATGAFDPGTSDVDLLAEFDLSGSGSALEQYIGFIHAAEALLGCKVDLVNPSTIQNPYFLKGVEESRRPLYAA
ncbi:MAG: nucleotidyltransferase domain-containing protein [Planctomycetota bacterium]